MKYWTDVVLGTRVQTSTFIINDGDDCLCYTADRRALTVSACQLELETLVSFFVLHKKASTSASSSSSSSSLESRRLKLDLIMTFCIIRGFVYIDSDRLFSVIDCEISRILEATI